MNTDRTIVLANKLGYQFWAVHRKVDPMDHAKVERLLSELKELCPKKWEPLAAHYAKCPLCKI